MATIYPVLNQGVYPEAGDVDDCWVVASIWAARQADPRIKLPTVTTFRAAAGDPDDGISDGGTPDEVLLGSRTLWPHLRIDSYRQRDFIAFFNLLKAGATASLAVMSWALPFYLRFGFQGAHQVAVAWDGRQLVLMNPLAPNGSAPVPVTAPEVQSAAYAYGNNRIIAAIFHSFQEDSMPVTLVKAEDWSPGPKEAPARRPVRATADRPRGTIIGWIEVGQTVRTIAEATTSDGNNWRLMEFNDRPGWILRSDFYPLVQGGDLSVDALFGAFLARASLSTPAQVAARVAAEGARIRALLVSGARIIFPEA